MVDTVECINVLIWRVALKQFVFKKCLAIGDALMNCMVHLPGLYNAALRLESNIVIMPAPLAFESIVIDFIEASCEGCYASIK